MIVPQSEELIVARQDLRTSSMGRWPHVTLIESPTKPKTT